VAWSNDFGRALILGLGALIPIGALAATALREIQAFRRERDERQREGDAQADLNDAARGLVRDLREDNEMLRLDRDRERSSGLGHYEKTQRLYGMLTLWFSDWHSGKPPPAQLPRMEDI
jgi:hypothetical protein